MSTTSQNPANQLVAAIQICRGSERPRVVRMDDASSVIVGGDESCGIRLDDPQVAPKHCMLRMDGGQMFVSDWYSEAGTQVNGEKIYTEIQLESGDTLQVGPFQIRYATTSALSDETPTFGDGQPAADEPTADEPTADEQPATASVALGDGFPGATHAMVSSGLAADCCTVSTGDSSPICDEEADLRQQLAEANCEIRRLRDELEFQLTLQPMDAAGPDDVDPMQVEETELLQAEVQQLQNELAQREAELQEWINGQSPAFDDVPSEETTRLVERLEQLLDELHQSDGRVRSLENLLQVSDEAAQAEKEERKQLENWVKEIETRIADREQQWRAREESLQAKLGDALQARESVEQRVAQITRGHNQEYQVQSEQQIAELRSKNQDLQHSLEQTAVEMRRLQSLVQQTGLTQKELEQAAEKQDQLRKHELEIAQERAALARQRAELVHMQDEIERTTQVASPSGENPDVRLRAFREHLKEIHEKEEEEKRQRSLSARISRIWQRLDGR